MKAFVYGGRGMRSLEDRPKPTLSQPAGVIVRITKTGTCHVCHILKGDVRSNASSAAQKETRCASVRAW
jgi:alcohol dehydrogenase